MYLHNLSYEEKVSLLKKRLETLQDIQEQVEQKKKHIESIPGMYNEVLFALDRDLSQRKADMDWTKALIEHYSKENPPSI
jgi:prefoldin subunit 5